MVIMDQLRGKALGASVCILHACACMCPVVAIMWGSYTHSCYVIPGRLAKSECWPSAPQKLVTPLLHPTTVLRFTISFSLTDNVYFGLGQKCILTQSCPTECRFHSIAIHYPHSPHHNPSCSFFALLDLKLTAVERKLNIQIGKIRLYF